MWILAVTIYHVLLDQIMSFLSCQILLSDFVHKERFKYFYRAVCKMNTRTRVGWGVINARCARLMSDICLIRQASRLKISRSHNF
jgi:hypothetical protein